MCGCASGEACFDSWFASEVVNVSFGPGQSFGRDAMPRAVLGPPRGGGCCKGSLDVVSLGNGGAITVRFDRAILDGPGPDFVVFENPFQFGQQIYAELGTVEVSDDGETFFEFPCTASGPPYGTCAGARPVFLDGLEGPVDPRTAGGDPFDLAALGLASARFVRITDRPDLEPPDKGSFELDAIGIVNGSEGLPGVGCAFGP
ncbi:MAG: hypothetical protein FJ095_02740 [Deltaproteobacteria bacterium]|nr:hypothetical protein [Deltaproteobacteria bacterium]